ncbi:helix-turn-helix domain-containing protein [Bacillus tianshenii]|nr:helix-turn-helix domain-containing protein [Bacillus tianshenii]
MNEQLLSVKEAAELLGVSKARIGHLVRGGKLQPAKE